ncbi:uncharacterized protein LOC126858486 isoform X2 [Cataglyphis hispanica]|uniref:uncharacterized protein LOC126858486 isoform X2 n=1 Tax=Cataglyphis hispanica TaxID=1086592 RepID=UPI002180970E|nr:uncharacterized protein LOC126858486 isoform X2 [Cataglyphis hispanica]
MLTVCDLFVHARESILSSFLEFLCTVSRPRRDMAIIDFQHLLLLITLFAAALTSSVNTKPDGISPVPSISSSDPSLKSSSSTVKYPSDVVDQKKISKSTSWTTEWGPISKSTTIPYANIENTADEFKAKKNMPKEKNDSSLARKEKIKPRKGVDQNMDPQMNPQITTKSVIETVSESASETIHVNSQSETSTIVILNLNVTNSPINNSLNHSMNSSYFSTRERESLIPTNITTFHTEVVNHTTMSNSSHIEKHIPKPKPTVTTVDGPESNESRLPLRTKNPSLGMPRKIDYIVPVIITIVALPILGAAIFVLYRRGRDCWDKRHYRRMDFLIDGMYND